MVFLGGGYPSWWLLMGCIWGGLKGLRTWWFFLDSLCLLKGWLLQ